MTRLALILSTIPSWQRQAPSSATTLAAARAVSVATLHRQLQEQAGGAVSALTCLV
jgi:hypothetical protein